MRLRSILVLGAAGLIGCTTEDSAEPSADSASAYFLHQERQPALAASGVVAVPQMKLSEVVVTGTSDALPPISAADVSNMVIRTANVSIEVDSLEPAVARVRELAARFGGYVASTNIMTGKAQLRSARLEVKIPTPRFEESLSGLSPIGKLESVSVEAEDVGEQFVDVAARMENARRLERRFIELLANRTGRLKDVLDVEQALARVREEIERYEGRIRYLRTHTATSTLGVYVHEPVPIVATAGRSVMSASFRQAWRNFVTLLSLAVQSLGVVLPLGIVAVAGWIVTRRLRLAKQRAA